MNGISTRCPCGGDIQTDITLPPKYRHDFDTHPGLRFFTRMKYEDDGMHVRQPWALGVEDEVRRLRREVNNMAEEIAKLKSLITSTFRP
ncbi:hypothetical protein Bca4012_057192 [Brassica carinata]